MANYKIKEDFVEEIRIFEADAPAVDDGLTGAEQLALTIDKVPEVAVREMAQRLATFAGGESGTYASSFILSEDEKMHSALYDFNTANISSAATKLNAYLQQFKADIVIDVNIITTYASASGKWLGRFFVTYNINNIRTKLEQMNVGPGQAYETVDSDPAPDVIGAIACSDSSSYTPGTGCGHIVPEGATHITYGAISYAANSDLYSNKEEYEAFLIDKYGSLVAVPSYEKRIPYKTEISTAGDEMDSPDNPVLPFDGFLKPGIYANYSGDQSNGYWRIQLIGVTGELAGKTLLVPPDTLQTVTWPSTGVPLTEEPKASEILAKTIMNRPLPVEPNMASLEGVTHTVWIPEERDLTDAKIRSRPGSGRILDKLQQGHGVTVVEQQLGPDFLYHKIKYLDLTSLKIKEGYIDATLLRPTKLAINNGDWVLLPISHSDNSEMRPAGSTTTAVVNQVLECSPWLKKGKDTKPWEAKYIALYSENAPVAPATIENSLETFKLKALARLLDYYDKETGGNTIVGSVVAIIKFGNVEIEDYTVENGILRIVISVPARFFDALQKNQAAFDFDDEPNLEKIREAAKAIALIDRIAETADVAPDGTKNLRRYLTPVGDEAIENAKAEMGPGNFKTSEKQFSTLDLNPSVDGHKLAFSTGVIYKDLQTQVKKLKKIFKYYDKKVRRSKSLVTFPGFSVPLNLKEESKKLDQWLAGMKELLRINDYDFSQAVTDKEASAKKDKKSSPGKIDSKDYLEFGFNVRFKLIYTLFNGHPIRVGFGCVTNDSQVGGTLHSPRTNSFIHRAKEIIKEYSISPRKRLSWLDWVSKYVYPAAIIFPEDHSDKSKKKKEKLKDTKDKADEKSAKTDEEVEAEEQAARDAEMQDEIIGNADRKKIDTKDSIWAGIKETQKLIEQIDDVYQFIMNKIPIEAFILEIMRCFGKDMSYTDIINLIVSLGLDEILEAYEENKDIIEDILAFASEHGACLEQLFTENFQIIVNPNPIETDPEIAVEDIEIPSVPDITAPNADYVVCNVASSTPSGSDPEIHFYEELPASGVPQSPLLAFQDGVGLHYLSEQVLPPAPGSYPGVVPPDSGDIPDELERTWAKVATTEKYDTIPIGQEGWIKKKYLCEKTAIVENQAKEERLAIIIEDGATDKRKGLINEVRAWQTLLCTSNANGGFFENTDCTTNIDGIYRSKTLYTTKNYGTYIKANPDEARGGPFTEEEVALLEEGKVCKALFDPAAAFYAAQTGKSATARPLKDVEDSLQYRTPEIVLGNVTFAPKGFYEGKKTKCTKKYIEVVVKKKEYEKRLLKKGPDEKKVKELKEELAKLFLDYHTCMKASKEDVYGNLKSHIFGKDITSEELVKTDSYKIVLHENRCKDKKDALIQLLGGTDLLGQQHGGTEEAVDPETTSYDEAVIEVMWPGSETATPEQNKAFEEWMQCIQDKANEVREEQNRQIEEQVKAGVPNPGPEYYDIPTSIEEALELLLRDGILPDGIELREDHDFPGLILNPGPCQDIAEQLIEYLLEIIREKYPWIETTIMTALDMYKEGLEMYQASQSQDFSAFGIPAFPKLPVDDQDKMITKEFNKALGQILSEILLPLFMDLISMLMDLCAKSQDMSDDDLASAAEPILQQYLEDPHMPNLLDVAFQHLGIVAQPDIENDRLRPVFDRQEAPTIYDLLESLMGGLSCDQICSIMNGDAPESLLRAISDSMVATYPEQREIFSKLETIVYLFSVLAEGLPIDYCDTCGGPGAQELRGPGDDIPCLADVTRHRRKNKLILGGLREEDADAIVENERKRNLENMKNLGKLLNNPEIEIPDICSKIKDTLTKDPNLNLNLNNTIKSQMRLIHHVFNTDISAYIPRMTSPIPHSAMSIMTDSFVEVMDQVKELEDTVAANPAAALSFSEEENTVLQQFMQDPENFSRQLSANAIQSIGKGPAQNSDQEKGYLKGVGKIANALKTVEVHQWCYLSEECPFFNDSSEEAIEYYKNNEPKWIPLLYTDEYISYLSNGQDLKRNIVVINQASIFALLMEDYEGLDQQGAAVLYNTLLKQWTTQNEDGSWPPISTKYQEFLLVFTINPLMPAWPGGPQPNSPGPEDRAAIYAGEMKAPRGSRIESSDYGYITNVFRETLGNIFTAKENPVWIMKHPEVPGDRISTIRIMTIEVPYAEMQDRSFSDGLAFDNITNQDGINMSSLYDVFKNPPSNLIGSFRDNTGKHFKIKRPPNFLSLSTKDNVVEFTLPNHSKLVDQYRIDINESKVEYKFSPESKIKSSIRISAESVGYDAFASGIENTAPQEDVWAHWIDKIFSTALPNFDTFGSAAGTGQYTRHMHSNIFKRIYRDTLRTISESKYWKEEELAKLNLGPTAEELMKQCSVIFHDPSLSLLNLKELRNNIKDSFFDDFNPCDPMPGDEDPGALQIAVREAAVLLMIRVTIIEILLTGIFPFSRFDMSELLTDSFFKQYMFERLKKELRRLWIYKPVKKVAHDIVRRMRKKDKKVIIASTGRESLIYLFQEQASVIIPHIKLILGNQGMLNIEEFVSDHLIFPIVLPIHRTKAANPSGDPYSTNQRFYRQLLPDTTGDATLAGVLSSKGIHRPADFFNQPGGGFVYERYLKIVDKHDEYGVPLFDRKLENIRKAFKSPIQTNNFGGFAENETVTSFVTQQQAVPNSSNDWHLQNDVTITTSEGRTIVVENLGSLQRHWGTRGNASLKSFGDWLHQIKVQYKQFLDLPYFNGRQNIVNAYESLLSSPLENSFSEFSFAMSLSYVLPDTGRTKQKYPDGWDDIIPDIFAGQIRTALEESPALHTTGLLPFRVKERDIPLPGGTTGQWVSIYSIPLIEVTTATVSPGGLSAEDMGIDGSLMALISMTENTSIENTYRIFSENNLIKMIKESDYFKLLFEYIFPVKRMINSASIYAVANIRDSMYLQDLFTSSMFALKKMFLYANAGSNPGKPVTDLQYDIPGFDVFESAIIADDSDEIIMSFIWKWMQLAPQLIIKGVAELIDPDISLTKKYFDIADKIVQTIMLVLIKILKKSYAEVTAKFRSDVYDAEPGEEPSMSGMPPGEVPTFEQWYGHLVGTDLPIPDPAIGISAKLAKEKIAPGIALGMMPSILPFGVGFPFPFGTGPPMTPFAIPYLALGLIKDGPDYRFGERWQLSKKPTGVKGVFCPDIEETESKPREEPDDD